MNPRLFTYLQAQRLLGSRCDRRYRVFAGLERADAAAIARWKATRLSALFTSAVRDVPFFRERLQADAVLGDFPILTKELIRAHFKELMPPAVRAEYEAHQGRCPRRYGWLEVKTGGSTGTPLAVLHGPDFRDDDRATRLIQHERCGFPFGTPYFRLWGSMHDINQMKDSWKHRAMTRLAGERVLNAFRMEAADLDAHLAALADSGIRFLMAYTDAAYQLALHARQRGGAAPRLDAIMACAGTLTPDIRATLGEEFGARVHNKYGSRDAGEMACDCEQGRLHELSGSVHLEVVDSTGRPCAPGVSGRLLVTCLENAVFPIIRYEIGDVAAWSGEACPCGRGMPVLERLEGRASDFVRSAAGGYVSPVFIRHVIGVVNNPGNFIERFQLEQTERDAFTLRVQTQTAPAGSQRDAWWSALVHDLREVLGREARIELEITPRIPESASGKFLHLINRTGGFR